MLISQQIALGIKTRQEYVSDESVKDKSSGNFRTGFSTKNLKLGKKYVLNLC